MSVAASFGRWYHIICAGIVIRSYHFKGSFGFADSRGLVKGIYSQQMREHGSGLRCKPCFLFISINGSSKSSRTKQRGPKYAAALLRTISGNTIRKVRKRCTFRPYISQFRHSTWSYEFGISVSPLSRNAGYRIRIQSTKSLHSCVKGTLTELGRLVIRKLQRRFMINKSTGESMCGRHSHGKKYLAVTPELRSGLRVISILQFPAGAKS